ncbi:MAG: FMN-binding negative transcriptional regulator [Candidatus Eremiobacteraeota bacterium]|nr:FMN-binding negative transcriptional regulator [Candidatus Eremiobacteraeota bacterium]
MYVPPHFAVDDRAWAQKLIAAYPFGMLLTCGNDYPRASHVPMLCVERNGELWILGHLARANSQADAIFEGSAATAVFQGPHAYVSPLWYEDPDRSVPTWNYLAVQCSGRLRECDGRDVVTQLAALFETGDERWSLDRVDPDYAEKQLRGIVAFEMRVDELAAKAKLGQNRSEADRARVEQKTGLKLALGW